MRVCFYLFFFFTLILAESNASSFSRIEQARIRLFPDKKGELFSGSFHFQGGSALGPRDVEIVWQDRKIVFRHIQNKKTMSIPLFGKSRIKEIKYLDIKGLNVKINPGEDIRLNLKNLHIVGTGFKQMIENFSLSCGWGNLKPTSGRKDLFAMCLRGESKISVGKFSLSKGFGKFLRRSIGMITQAKGSCKNIAMQNKKSEHGFFSVFYGFFISTAIASEMPMVSDPDCFRNPSLDVITQAFGKIYSFLLEDSNWEEFGKKLEIEVENGGFDLIFPYENKKIKIQGNAEYFPPGSVKLTLKKAKYGFFNVKKRLLAELVDAQINADSNDFNVDGDSVFITI